MMRKRVSAVLVAFCLLVCMLAAGCSSGGNSQNSPAGVWKVTSLQGEGKDDTGNSGYLTLEMTLNTDGTMTITGNGVVNSGTWKLENGQITLSVEGVGNEVLTYDGQQIIANLNGSLQGVFTRQGDLSDQGGTQQPGTVIDNGPTGVWTTAGGLDGGKVLSREEAIEAFGVDMTITLYEDGTAVIIGLTGSNTQTLNGTWTITGTQVEITANGSTEHGTLENGRLSLTSGGETIYFEKSAAAPQNQNTSADSSDYVGSWQLESCIMGGKSYTREQLLAEEGFDMQITLLSGGSAIITGLSDGETQYLEGTWTASAGGVTITADDSPVSGSLQNGKLVLADGDASDYSYTFARQ
ncbi:MAG: lipocalin family protein [Candidatus Heritagella sp.]